MGETMSWSDLRRVASGAMFAVLAACRSGSSSSEIHAAAELKIDEKSVITIGRDEASEAEQFYEIRSVVRMEDGRIVVADGGSNEVRFFTPDGRYIESVGRKGQGPGEFTRLSWVKRMDSDSLVAWDQELGRVTVMDPVGQTIRVFRIPADPEFWITIAEQIFPDGSILSVAGPAREEVDSAGNGFWTIVALIRTGPGGKNSGRIALVKQRRCPVPNCLVQSSLLEAVWAAASGSLYYYRPDQSVVEVLSLDGQSMSTIPLHGILAPIDTAAAVTAIKPDLADGLIWLRTIPNEWLALNAEGQIKASLKLPSALSVYEVTMDHVLGVAKDSTGIEYVQFMGFEGS